LRVCCKSFGPPGGRDAHNPCHLASVRTRGVIDNLYPQYHHGNSLTSYHGAILCVMCHSTIIPSSCYCIKQQVLGRTNRLLSLIRHCHIENDASKQLFYCVCIRYGGNVSTEPLPSNDTGNFTKPIPNNDSVFTKPLPSNDRGTFTEPLPSNDSGIHRHTHTPAQTAT
jgi:hypothetical protein